MFKKMLSAISMSLMIVLLLPTLGIVTVNSYAKTTLGKVGIKNRADYWRDLIDYLGKSEKRYRVLVDPITGYLVEALTPNRAYQYKFLPDRSYYRNTFVFDSYDDFPLSRYSGNLLVVNLRNGAPSRTGELSGHWDKNVLRISDYYPEKLIQHLNANPDRFEKRWSSDRISVYYIK